MNIDIDEDEEIISETDENKKDERRSEPETSIEFNQYLVEPTAESFFHWITKDMTLTYLDEADMERVRMLCEIIVTLWQLGMHECSLEFFGDLSAILNTGRSRHGFERQMEQTNIGKTFQYFDGEEEEKVNRGG